MRVSVHLSDNIRGAAWIVVSAIVATAMSAAVHGLAGQIHSIQTTFVRGAIGFGAAVLLTLPRHVYQLATPRWRLHLLRGLLGLAAINCGFFALSHLPLVTATALFFTAPLWVTLLAAPLLGERVGAERWGATLVGFCGTLVVVGMSADGFAPAMLFALASSMLFALLLIVGKKLSRTESPGTILVYFNLVIVLGNLPPAVALWTPPTLGEWLLLVVIGLTAAVRTYCDVRGYAAGEASFVAPFFYTRIVFVTAAGYVVFGEIPDRAAILGASIIVASALYIAQREARAAR